ncbi:transducin family protein/WD-40 repeat family protein [Exidia glandulosa HHB12029]|uniref:Transducin family protein/WD-40 repeat family protein n=1 Tax=Exidia glandulosa HHB12029 TaxID=1314781 RepID=A0A165KLN4_EXIGL|nr:transducin family protein/WD-40 repeat family protein [Exidia glandulosa HHB12029]
MSSHISSLSWVRRGVAQQHPDKYKLDEAEMARAQELIRSELENVDEADVVNDDGGDEWVDDDGAGEDDEDKMDEDMDVVDDDKDDMSKYKLDEYDDESASMALGPFSNVKGLTYYNKLDEDPYITLKGADEEDERKELEILPADNLILSARTEDDVSYLEVHVYDDAGEDLYVHHDILLPAVPLCLEWLDFNPRASTDAAPGNYVAIGTMDPEIEIWNLDVLDAAMPDAILGRPDETAAHVPVPLGTGKKKKKKTKKRTVSSAHHVDAVLAISWNRHHRNLLASGSADKTVKLWDLTRGIGGEEEGALRSFDVHTDTVQGVQWNTIAPTILLTGSYDRTVRTFDSRSPDQGVGARIGADVEGVRWDPFDEEKFYVSLDNGLVLAFDARTLPNNAESPAPALWTLSAHDGPASAMDLSSVLRGVLVTGGADKIVKVWDIRKEGGKEVVSPVISRDLGVGKVFSATWSPDDPLVLAAAGSKAKLQVWDVAANSGARKVFESKLKAAGREVRDRGAGSGGVIGVASDGEDDDSGDED